jgi:hypothetical protein
LGHALSPSIKKSFKMRGKMHKGIERKHDESKNTK